MQLQSLCGYGVHGQALSCMCCKIEAGWQARFPQAVNLEVVTMLIDPEEVQGDNMHRRPGVLLYHQHVEECCGSKGLACKTIYPSHPLPIYNSFVGEGSVRLGMWFCWRHGLSTACRRLIWSRLYTD